MSFLIKILFVSKVLYSLTCSLQKTGKTQTTETSLKCPHILIHEGHFHTPIWYLFFLIHMSYVIFYGIISSLLSKYHCPYPQPVCRAERALMHSIDHYALSGFYSFFLICLSIPLFFFLSFFFCSLSYCLIAGKLPNLSVSQF